MFKQTQNDISFSQKDSVELTKIADTVALATCFIYSENKGL